MSRPRRLRARRGHLLIVALAAAAALFPTGACAEGWHSAQPPAPSPPEGQSGIGVPVPLGEIGQISFWAPNRGLLITAGTKVVPAGLYYYNGVSWRELSTVCGGEDGRIVWAGENDFWTIATQQTGQQVGGGVSAAEEDRDRSLCHFENGKVVASYGEPIGVRDSYQHMYAAACAGPDDCWFAGETLPPGPNRGAFHLHWNGQTMTPLPSLEEVEAQAEDPTATVKSMAFYQGRLYESVEGVGPGESGSEPFLIHKIVEGSSKPFEPMILAGLPGEAFSYNGVPALQLSATSGRLWAAGGSVAMQLNAQGQFQQLKLEDPTGALAKARIVAIAAEPGSGAAWVSLAPEGEGSSEVVQVVRIEGDGAVGAAASLPEAGEQLARKGGAGAIACPAPGDCWVASSKGWLFHLGGDYPEDGDSYFQSLITYRPADPSVPFLAPETFPEDDSGDNPPQIPAPPSAAAPGKSGEEVRAPLFSGVNEKLVNRTTLALTFTLTTKSHVKLLALRKKRTVAHTRSYVLPHGRHTLTLHLDRAAWPTKLDLQVQAIGPVPLVAVGSHEHEASGGPTAVETSYRPRPSSPSSARP
jgi:hypothetical protein